MLQQSRFNFSSRDSMTRYVDDIIHSPRNPIVSIFVPSGTISCKLRQILAHTVRVKKAQASLHAEYR